jgi:hypothetical protein
MAIIQSKALQATKRNPWLNRLWFAAVVIIALLLGYVGPYFITKPSTVAIVVVGLALIGVFGVILAGHYFLGLCLFIIAIPTEDYVRRIVYNGRPYPHLDPIHLIVEALVACVVGGLILRAVFTKTRPQTRGLAWFPALAIFYLAYLIIQIINPASVITASLQGFIQLGYYIVVFLAVPFVIKDERQVRILLWITVVCAGISGAYGVFQHFHMPPWDKWELQRMEEVVRMGGKNNYLFMGNSPRAFSSFGSYESFGGYEVINICFGWMVMWVSRRWYLKVIAFLLTIAMVSGLMFTYSRSCWTGAVFDVILLTVLLLRTNWFNRVIVAISLVAVAIVAFIVLAYLSTTPLADNNLVLQRIAQTVNGNGIHSIEDRQTETQALVQYTNQHPLGAGEGAAVPAQNGTAGPQVNGKANTDDYFHGLMFAIGYPGLALFLLVTIVALILGLRYFLTVRSPYLRALMATCVVIILSVMLIDGGEPFLFFDGVPQLYWLVLGLIYIAPRLDEHWIEQQQAQQQVVTEDTALLPLIPV